MKNINLFCIISFVLGILSLIFGSLNESSTVLIIIAFAISATGTLFAFLGRIQSLKSNANAKWLANAGIIMNTISFSGSIIYYASIVLGEPTTFAESENMLFFVLVSSATVLLSAGTIISYFLVSKKLKNKMLQDNK